MKLIDLVKPRVRDSRTAGLAAIGDAAHPLSGAASDFDPLLEWIGDARFVLLGEATHGTQEFYAERATITKRLIEEKGFNAVVVEADWPDALRVHRYVRGRSEDHSANKALLGFRRFPTWMWRNTVVVDFVEWLREHNTRPRAASNPAGFYGMDLYSLHSSIDEVLTYLEKTDAEAALRARKRYSCFELFGSEPQEYGYAATRGMVESCEDAVVAQLVEIRRKAADFLSRDGQTAADEWFFAEQNARLVKNAEEYYRSMFRGRASSWNLRDRHMVETIEALVTHLDGQRESKVVVWAHNSHLGDARATDMSKRGEWNVGQLMRERFKDEAFLVGFSTHHGTVTAASDWGDKAERKRVRPGLNGSYEDLFHDVEISDFLLNLRERNDATAFLSEPRMQRAIGVIYLPATERYSHYFESRLPEQFDAIIHIDKTNAVEPLERTSLWDQGELPETFPSGV